MPVQLSPVNFLRLMDTAERRVIPKGSEIKKGGAPHKEVILIVEGTAEVRVWWNHESFTAMIMVWCGGIIKVSPP